MLCLNPIASRHERTHWWNLSRVELLGLDPDLPYVDDVPDHDDVIADLARNRLAWFFKYSWRILEPTQKLIWNWHLEAIADHIQAALEDWIQVQNDELFVQRFKRLIANVPPGSSKSRIISVCAPAWMWLHHPSWRVLCLSSNPRVSFRDSLFCRDLVRSEWYQRLFAPDWGLRTDQDAKSSFWNTAGGWRQSAGWFGNITGDRHDCIIMDDPHDAQEVNSDQIREATITRYDTAIANRVTSANALQFNVGQRVHHEDISAHLRRKGHWRIFVIPQIFEPERLKAKPDYSKDEYDKVSPIGWTDPRTEAGELLDPIRFPPEQLEIDKEDLGTAGFNGQHQQRPTAASGSTWKRFWWGYWTVPGLTLEPIREPLENGSFHECKQIQLPSTFELMLQSWDMAFGGGKTSSMVVGQVWGLDIKDRFLLDQDRGQRDFVESKAAVRRVSENWPDVETKLIEYKANGPAIISDLKADIDGMKAIEPEGDKVARAMAEQATLEAGRVFLPHPGLFTLGDDDMRYLERTYPQVHAMVVRAKLKLAEEEARPDKAKAKPQIWVKSFVDESAKFPKGSFLDVVDTASQALMWMRKYIKRRDKQANTQTQGTASWKSSR